MVLAAVTRCAEAAIRVGPLDGIDLTAALWMSAFAILALRLGPWLAKPKVDWRRPTGLPLNKPS